MFDFILLYLSIGFMVNCLLYWFNSESVKELTYNQLTLNFILTWVGWVFLLIFFAIQYIARFVTHRL